MLNAECYLLEFLFGLCPISTSTDINLVVDWNGTYNSLETGSIFTILYNTCASSAGSLLASLNCTYGHTITSHVFCRISWLVGTYRLLSYLYSWS